MPILPSFTGGNAYHVLFISLTPFALYLLAAKPINSFHLKSFVYLIAFLLLTALTYFNHDENDFSSIISSLKIIYFYSYVIIGYHCARVGSRSTDALIACIKFVFVFSIITSCVEYLFPSISHFLYKRSDFEILEDKLTSIFNTTYHYAFFLFVVFSIYISYFIDYTSKSNNSSRSSILIIGMLLAVSFVLIALTQSRIFFLTGILVILGALIYPMFTSRTNYLVVALITLIAMSTYFAITLLGEHLGYLLYGIELLLSGGLDFSGAGAGSFNTRINQIIFAYDAISSNIYLGAGVGKDLYLETLYAYALYKYGFTGLGLILLLALYLSFVSLNLVAISTTRSDRVIARSMFILFLTFPFYTLGGPIFEVPKLSFLFFFLIGFLFGLRDRIRYGRASAHE